AKRKNSNQLIKNNNNILYHLMNFEDLHDITKNLQPAPVPEANPWHNAAKRLSISKEQSSCKININDKTNKNDDEFLEEKENLNINIENANMKNNNQETSNKDNEILNGRRKFDNQRSVEGKNNNNYNGNGNNRRVNGKQNRNRKYTPIKSNSNLDELNNVVEETRRNLNSFNIGNNKGGNISENVNYNKYNINNNHSNHNIVENSYNNDIKFKRKSRSSFLNFNRNYLPPSPLPLPPPPPHSPHMIYNLPLPTVLPSQLSPLPSLPSSSSSPSTSSSYNNGYFNQRRFSSPQFDQGHHPQYMRYSNGFNPMIQSQSQSQSIPNHIQTRIFYNAPSINNDVRNNLPIMISPNGIPIQMNMNMIMNMNMNMNIPMPMPMPIPGSMIYNRNENENNINNEYYYNNENGMNLGRSNIIRNEYEYVEDNGEYEYEGINDEQDEEQNEGIKRQVRYYFSIENLCKDMYLRKQMDKEGFININIIKKFSRINTLSNGNPNIIDLIIKDIIEIEIKGDIDSGEYKIRIKDGWDKWIL
ncbi:hypothetical protein C6P40_002263, partial [Pichia californica]